MGFKYFAQRFTLLILSCVIIIMVSYDTMPIQKYKVPMRSFADYEPTRGKRDNTISENISLDEFFSVVNVSSSNVFLTWPLEPILNYRALCSVESWAFNHPNGSVWYIFTVDKLQDPDGLTQKLMGRYWNLNFLYVDIEEAFHGTPLYNLSLSSPWEQSSWPGTHLNDLLRQALLWHKGGYYADTDVYPIKSLSRLRNFILARTNGNIGPALQHFDAHHPYMKAFMEVQAKDFMPDDYRHNGPVASTTAAKRLCDGPDGFLVLQANGSYRDCIADGQIIHFLQPEKHFPIYTGKAIKPGKGIEFEKLVSRAYGFHSCSSVSRHIPDTFTSDSLLQNMAKINCPLIFELAQMHSNFW